jgi:hypothetical protein
VVILKGDRTETPHRHQGTGAWEIRLRPGLYYLKRVSTGEQRVFEIVEGQSEVVYVTPE